MSEPAGGPGVITLGRQIGDDGVSAARAGQWRSRDSRRGAPNQQHRRHAHCLK